MKKYIHNTILCAAVLTAAALSSCGGDREIPPMIIPSTDWKANTTIQELKEKYYDASGFSYTVPIEQMADGTDMMISGRVISSDESGNIFKQVFIADETGAIQINIDSYDLYETYHFGQEIVLNVTGLYAGAYGRQMQIGGASTTYPQRLSTDVMSQHMRQNGLGQPKLVDTVLVTLDQLKAATAGTENWFKFQSQLIRVNGVYFVDAGKATLSTSGSSGVSRTLKDTAGNSLVLYTSGYSVEDMYAMICPEGTGDVVGILQFYNNNWQLKLIDTDGLIGFTPVYEIEPEPVIEPAGAGTQDDPYNVTKALEIINSENIPAAEVYVKGIISEIQSIDTGSYGNATYFISDTGSTSNQLEVYRGYSLNGNKFTSDTEIQVGNEVVIKGKLTLYNKTPEVSTGSSIVSIKK